MNDVWPSELLSHIQELYNRGSLVEDLGVEFNLSTEGVEVLRNQLTGLPSFLVGLELLTVELNTFLEGDN